MIVCDISECIINDADLMTPGEGSHASSVTWIISGAGRERA